MTPEDSWERIEQLEFEAVAGMCILIILFMALAIGVIGLWVYLKLCL